ETLVAILGVLKAGAAYVPLDPEYPQDRLSFILQDARVAVLLTQESVRGRLPEYEGPTVCLEREWDERVGIEGGEDLEGGAAPDPRALSGELLVEALSELGITTVTLPPAVLAVTTPGYLPALRTVVSAGESCSPETVARWGRHCRVINAYGPTENTVCATMHEC